MAKRKMTRKKRMRTEDISGIVLLMLRNARLICLPARKFYHKMLIYERREDFTFRDVDNEEGSERATPSN